MLTFGMNTKMSLQLRNTQKAEFSSFRVLSFQPDMSRSFSLDRYEKLFHWQLLHWSRNPSRVNLFDQLWAFTHHKSSVYLEVGQVAVWRVTYSDGRCVLQLNQNHRILMYLTEDLEDIARRYHGDHPSWRWPYPNGLKPLSSLVEIWRDKQSREQKCS